MPDYEYHCSSCGHASEIFQKISEDPVRICPSCKAETFERLISRSSFALRGSGWYADGYGAKSEKSADSKPEKSAGAATEKSDKKPEPAAAPEKKDASPSPAKSSSKED